MRADPTSPYPPAPRFALLVAVLTAVVAAGCGGGGAGVGGAAGLEAPIVQAFSPRLAPVNPTTGTQQATFTDARLRVATDLRYGGRIAIFFQGGTDLDPASIHLGGDPSLGPAASALSVQRELPGVGNVTVPVSVTLVDAAGSGTRNAILCQPLPPFSTNLGDPDGDGVDAYATGLPDGQYTVGVYDGVRSRNGRPLRGGPVFHTFTVGAADTIAPRVVTTTPVNGEQNVGAGLPPPPTPPGVPEENIAEVTTNIFGASSPDVVVRFTESIAGTSITLTSVQVIDAGAFVPGGGAPPILFAAAGYPKLRDATNQGPAIANGHELIWRPSEITGGFPFGTQIQVRLAGSWRDAGSRAASPGAPDNAFPLRDLSGNAMELDHVFTFQTIAPPNLPENPFPEYAIWWSAEDRVGTIDGINQQGLADQFLGTAFPFGVPRNVVPEFTDTVANASNIPNFDPYEINFDGRTNPATCHTWVYVQSHGTGQVAVLDSRDGIPVALIDSPSPGGLAVQVGAGSANALVVTNSGANTFTAYDIGLQTPGTRFLNGPLFIRKVQPTGNTPRAVAFTSWGHDAHIPGWNRDGANTGPVVPTLMYADYTDGVVNTITLSDDRPVRQFALGPTSAPNDVCFTPCFNAGGPIMFAAISQGGAGGQGKVAYYVAGPGCMTGSATNARPDAIVGDLTGFDGPDGLDENFQSGTPVFFTVAESGSVTSAVTTLGIAAGAGNLPRLINRFTNVGANPNKVAHRASWLMPCIAVANTGACAPPNTPSCWYAGTEQGIVNRWPNARDLSMVPTKDLYVCARGDSLVTVIDLTSGSRNFYSPVSIPRVRFVAGPATQ